MRYVFVIIVIAISVLDCKAQELIPYSEDSLWGYRSKSNNVVISPQYQYATKFFNSIAVVAKNNKLGAIDKSNNVVIPFRYEFLRPLDTGEFLFGYRTKYFGEYRMGVMTTQEKIIIPANYYYISKYKHTFKVTKHKDSVIGKSPIGDVRAVNSFYGLFDSKGNVIIPCRYGGIRWLNDNLIVVDSLTPSANGKYQEVNLALFNSNGDRLTDFIYMAFGNFNDGLAKARVGNKYGFIDSVGKIAIPIKFDYSERFKNGYAIIEQNKKWGAVNTKGKIVIEPKLKYEEVKAKLKQMYGR